MLGPITSRKTLRLPDYVKTPVIEVLPKPLKIRSREKLWYQGNITISNLPSRPTPPPDKLFNEIVQLIGQKPFIRGDLYLGRLQFETPLTKWPRDISIIVRQKLWFPGQIEITLRPRPPNIDKIGKSTKYISTDSRRIDSYLYLGRVIKLEVPVQEDKLFNKVLQLIGQKQFIRGDLYLGRLQFETPLTRIPRNIIQVSRQQLEYRGQVELRTIPKLVIIERVRNIITPIHVNDITGYITSRANLILTGRARIEEEEQEISIYIPSYRPRRR